MLPDFAKQWRRMPDHRGLERTGMDAKPRSWTASDDVTKGIEKRDTTDCPSPQYTANNGLEFNTFCGQAFDTSQRNVQTIGTTTEKSSVDCMNVCASSDDGTCFGIWYNITDSTCWQLDRSAFNSTRYSSDTDNVAVTPYTQWRAPTDTSCPLEDGFKYTTDNGQEFDIICDKDFAGFGDMCRLQLGAI